MTVAKTLCHIHEAGACHEGCVYAYSLDDETHVQARAYYSLCDRARAVGVPTDCDDPASPTTVAGLEAAVTAAENARIGRCKHGALAAYCTHGDCVSRVRP